VLGWFGVLQWHYEHKKEMPVNLVRCFEGMERGSLVEEEGRVV
jgi:Cys-Gly metallodipeptidase DUG1